MNLRSRLMEDSMLRLLIMLMLSLMFTMCATAQPKGASYNVLQYSDAGSAYDKYLVVFDSYTTNGSVYHKKYLNYLYGIAKIFTDEKKTKVSEKSIGFYFDKKENRKDKLFLGVDLIADEKSVDNSADYEKNVRSIFNKLLNESMSVLGSCTEILKETEVQGVVIGFIWYRNGNRELVNIWIPKDELTMFYNDSLTMNELVIRSTVTNTDGRIIRMSL
jgi:hypothetical protein